MDPNLFHLDWDRLAEVLITLIVLAFILERALSVIFESKLFVASALDRGIGKESIALIVAGLVCRAWHFDAISMIILSEKTTMLGELITAGIIAGGSKASVKLFRDLLDVKSSAVRLDDLRKVETAASQMAAQTGGSATAVTSGSVAVASGGNQPTNVAGKV